MVCSNCIRHDAGMDLLVSPPLRPALSHSGNNPLSTTATKRADALKTAEPIFLDDGAMLMLRPIGQGDVDALMRAFKRMTPEQVRARVFHALSELPEPVARAMCRVGPDQGIALVATDPDGAEIRAEARVHFDAIADSAELAIAIDPDYTGRGLGRILVEHLIAASRTHGIREIWGNTQAGNNAMLALTRRLGFTHHRERDDASLVRFNMDLATDLAHGRSAKR